MGDALKILFLSPEVAPYAKTGGLADVAGSLPGALRSLGMDVMVGLPYYRTVRENGVSTKTVLPGLQVALNGTHLPCDVLDTKTDDGGRVFFIDREEFYDRDDLYATQNGDYPDNLERFSYFNRAALLFAKETGFDFDVVHCHDWQTGLVPAFLRTRYAKDPFFARVKIIIIIIEPLIQAKDGIKNKGPNTCPCLITMFLHYFSKCHCVMTEKKVTIITHTMLHRIKARHDR